MYGVRITNSTRAQGLGNPSTEKIDVWFGGGAGAGSGSVGSHLLRRSYGLHPPIIHNPSINHVPIINLDVLAVGNVECNHQSNMDQTYKSTLRAWISKAITPKS